MEVLGEKYKAGQNQDLILATKWLAKSGNGWFWIILYSLFQKVDGDSRENLGCDLNLLAMELGKGLYWSMYGGRGWKSRQEETKAFGERCLDYYCDVVETQQNAVLLFLMFWNNQTGIKVLGQNIGKMVWRERNKYLVKKFV